MKTALLPRHNVLRRYPRVTEGGHLMEANSGALEGCKPERPSKIAHQDALSSPARPGRGVLRIRLAPVAQGQKGLLRARLNGCSRHKPGRAAVDRARARSPPLAVMRDARSGTPPSAPLRLNGAPPHAPKDGAVDHLSKHSTAPDHAN